MGKMATSGGRMQLPTWIALVVSLTGVMLAAADPNGRGQNNYDEKSSTTVIACEGSTANIRCLPGEKIHIERANYGRLKAGICVDENDPTQGWNLACSSPKAISRVPEFCEGRSHCSVIASNRLFGDPCKMTPKYLEVEWQCQQDWLPPATTTDTSARSTTPSTTLRPTPVITPQRTRTPRPTVRTTAPSPQTPLPATTVEIPSSTGPPSHIEDQPTFCEAIFYRNISWPRAPAGATVRKECPNNLKLRAAVWRCGRRRPIDWLEEPNLSRCVSDNIKRIQAKLARAKESMSTEIFEEVAHDLVEASHNHVYGGDLVEEVKVMKDIVSHIEMHSKNISSKQEKKKLLEGIEKAVLSTSSNMLEDHGSWKDLPQAMQAETATRMISSVEDSAYNMAEVLDQPDVIINITVNIVLELNVIDLRSGNVPDLHFPSQKQVGKGRSSILGQGNSIRMSGNALKELGSDGLAKVIFLSYNNLEKWLRPLQDASSNVGELTGKEEQVKYFDKKPTADPNKDRGALKPEPGDLHIPKDPKYRLDDVVNKDEKPETNVQTQQPGTEGFDYELDAQAGDEQAQNDTQVVNSKVISATVLQKRKEGVEKTGHIPLKEPIYYTLEHKSTKNVYNPTCSFWEYSERTMSGRWSNFGCRVKETNVTHTICACNHVTNFAILMDVHGTQLSDKNEFALTFITYFGCVISCVCLLICFITFVIFKNLQCDRNTIHKNLVLCLLIAELLFLLGIRAYNTPILCSVIAGFLHYTFLTAFMWMLMEGIQLYVMLVEVFEPDKSRVKYYYLAAYGVPAIIVGISAAVYHEGYGTDQYCWLTVEHGFIWAFVGPVIAILAVNSVMLSIAIYQMCKHAKNAASWKMKSKSKLESIRSWVKGAVVLVILLGLTWMFGLLYIEATYTLAFAYIFTILNSFQGLFIFIFHCAMNEKVQKEYKRCVRRSSCLPEWVRVKYGGAKPYASSTPLPSSSSGNHLFSQRSTQDQKLSSFEALTRLLRRKRSSTTTLRSSSTSTTPLRWTLQNMKPPETKNSESAPLSDSGIGQEGIYSEVSEDPAGYLEPVKLRVNDSMVAAMEADISMSNMEGSIADTDYMEHGKSQSPINVDKYKIQNPNRLSTVSQEKPLKCDCSEDDSEDDEDEDDNLKKRLSGYSSVDEHLMNGDPDSSYDNDTIGREKARIRRMLDENEAPERTPPPLNDLNKSDNSGLKGSKDLSSSLDTPNINVHHAGGTGGKGSLNRNLDSSSASPSQDEAVNKLKKALATSDDGLVTVIHGGKKPSTRLSDNTQEALDAHRMRLTSSDC